jgi:DinB family
MDSPAMRTFKKFPNLSGEHLAKILDFRGALQLPAVTWFNFSLHRTIHHRGQLSMYMRAMGGKVPTIYSQSYDSEAATKSAQI